MSEGPPPPPTLPIAAHDVATAVALLGVQMVGLTKVVEQMATEIRQDRQTYVSQQLWQQRNSEVNDKLGGIGREIGDLRVELRSRRVSWPAVGAFAVAGGALLLQLIQALGS